MQALSEASRSLGTIAEGGSFGHLSMPLRPRVSFQPVDMTQITGWVPLAALKTIDHGKNDFHFAAGTYEYL